MADLTRIEVSIISLIVGWTIAQITEIVKTRRNLNKIKDAVIDELNDVMSLLREDSEKAFKVSQEYSTSNPTYIIGFEISMPIFDKRYSEISHEFNKEQRHAIRTFVNHTKHYNKKISEITSLKSGEASAVKIKSLFFDAYKHGAYAATFLEICNKSGGKEITDDYHPKLVELKALVGKRADSVFES